jgi:GR25 family glycosyltransferase involved in LPS biosynthesis
MERLFSALEIGAERIEACTPETLPADCRAAFGQADRIRRLEDVEMACLASHRAAMRAVIDSGARAGVILEDDVRISRYFARQVRNLADRADFDIARLETFQPQYRMAGPAQPLTDGFAVYGMAEFDGGAGGYMVTREGAERYLAQAIDPTVPADDWLFNMQCAKPRRLRALQLVPAVVIQFWHRSPDGPMTMDTDLQAARNRRYDRQGTSFAKKASIRPIREVRRVSIRLRKAIERFRHGTTVFYRCVKPHVAFADDLKASSAVETGRPAKAMQDITPER